MSNMKKNKRDMEEVDDRWSKLPHVLQLIPKRLHISDYQSFRYVCKNWLGAIQDGIATKSCSPAPQLSWLLLRSNDCTHACLRHDETKHALVRDPNIFRSVAAGPFAYSNCIGSIGARLIIAGQHHLNNNNTNVVNFFLNPISGARIMLPSQSTINSHLCNDLYFLKKVVASSDPDAQHCRVAGASSDGLLCTCTPSDASWNQMKSMFKVRDIELIDEKYYVIIQRENLDPFIAVFKDHGFGLEITWLGSLPYINNWNWKACCLGKDDQTKEMFVILHQIPVKRQSTKEGLFKVFRLESDLSLRLSIGARWTEVVDLGDRMLFLSERSNKCVRDETLGKNCIYFALVLGCTAWRRRESNRLDLVKRKDLPSSKPPTELFGSHHIRGSRI